MSGGMAALLYDIVTAGRGQHKQKKKKGNNQPEVWQHEWWRGGNCCATSGNAWGLGWGEATGEVVAVDAAAEMTATASWQQEEKWCVYNQHSSKSDSDKHVILQFGNTTKMMVICR